MEPGQSAFGVGGNTNEADRANDGIVHVTLETPHYDWTVIDENTMATLGQAFAEALRAADPYVDFASYNTNGDGGLQNNEMALGFVVAGYEGTNGVCDHSEYGLDNYLWSHAYQLVEGLEKVTAKFGKAKWKVTAKDKKGVPSLKNGKVRVKKGAEAGTYAIKLRASVAKTKNYKAASTRTVTVKVTISSGKAKSSNKLVGTRP